MSSNVSRAMLALVAAAALSSLAVAQQPLPRDDYETQEIDRDRPIDRDLDSDRDIEALRPDREPVDREMRDMSIERSYECPGDPRCDTGNRCLPGMPNCDEPVTPP